MKTKIAFLGNADNINLKVCYWLRQLGYEAHIYTADFGGRGGVHLYFNQEELKSNSDWIFDGKLDKLGLWSFVFLPSRQRNFINKEYDLVVVSGLSGLVASNVITRPKLLSPVGYEVNHFCNPKIPFKIKSINSFFRRLASYYAVKSLKKIDLITDFFEPDHEVYKFHKVFSKVSSLAIGEDCEKVRSFVKKALLEQLVEKTKGAKKVFLWLTRLNYKDPSIPEYKGADLFLKSLETQLEALKSGELVVYMGKHGLDVDDFMKLCEGFECSQYINWIGHLDYPELITYLSIPNAILFTEFGDVNSSINGITRDGYAIGIPMVNSSKDNIMIAQYGAPGPRFFCKTVEDIANTMQHLLNLSNDAFEELREKTLEYGNNYLDYKNYIPALIKLIQQRLNISID